MEKRTRRRNVELCRDIPQYQLCHEVAEIDGSIKALTEKLYVAETAMQGLLQDLTRIEDDLGIKTKSLALDQRCERVREKLRVPPSQQVVSENISSKHEQKENLSSKMKDLSVAGDFQGIDQNVSGESSALHADYIAKDNKLFDTSSSVGTGKDFL